MTWRVEEVAADDPRRGTELYALLRELRPGLTRPAFEAVLAGAGVRVLVAGDDAGRWVGAALYRVLATSRGRIFFVDDLVTAARLRSSGVGGRLLAELEARGRAARCERLELDSGVANEAAHRFYRRHGMSDIALHFAKRLDAA